MRMQRLVGLERDKIKAEYDELLQSICYLRGLLEDEARRWAVVRQELLEIRDKYADERRHRDRCHFQRDRL